MNEQELMLLAKARRRRAEAEAAAAAEAQQAQTPPPAEGGVQLSPLGQRLANAVGYNPDNGQPPAHPIDRGMSGLDTAANILSSGVGSIVGGASALPMMAVKALMGGSMDEVVDQGNTTLESVADALTWSPKTKTGQEAMGAVGGKMEQGMLAGRDALHSAEAVTGIPGLAVAGEIGAQGLLELVPGAKAVKARKARIANVPELGEAAKAARRLGIDLNNETIRDSVVEAGRTLTGDSSVATSGLEAVTAKVAAEKRAARAVVKEKYDAVRNTEAGVYADPFVDLGVKLEDRLIKDGANFKADSALTARINDLRNLRETMFGAPKGRDARPIPGQSSTILGADGRPITNTQTPVQVPLNEIVGLRQAVSDDISRVKKTDPAQARHLQIVKRELDKALDEQFRNDMIYGDKAAKARWVEAKAAHADMMARFGDDRTIAKLADEALTPTEVANLVFGASENGAKAGSIRVLRKVKAIIGDDQPALDALTTAVYAKIMEPLMQPEPGWSTFRRRVRKWSSQHKAILDEVGISEKDLQFLSKASSVAEKVKTTKMIHNQDNKTLLSSMIARLSFGHDIAKAGVRVKLANMFTDYAFGVGQKTHEQLLREFAMDPDAPLLKPNYPKLRYYAARAAAEGELQGRGDNNEEE